MSSAPECLPLDHGGPIDRPFEPFPYSALDGSIIDRFDTMALRFSARLAVSDSVRHLTYAELSTLVDKIAAATTRSVADRTGPVAILLPSNAYFPAAILGVLAASRGYVPLDANYPIERNRLIAIQSAAAAVVSAGDLAGHIRTLFPQELPVVDIETISDAPRPRQRPAPDDLAQIIYTSGSTGTPKGVYQSHRNLLHDILQWTNTVHFNKEDRVALMWSPSIFTGLRDIFVTLLNGASLHILPPQNLEPDGLIREIRIRKITIFRAAPTLLRRIAQALGPDERFDTVRFVGLASEHSDWSDFDIFRRIFPSDAFLFVGLGSTECAVFCHWFVDDRLRAMRARLPVGLALSDRTVTLMDEAGCSVADGEIGEFVVAGRYLALGYWLDPELTARTFTTDQADSAIRIFRTGDMGYRRPDRLFEFVGRKDDQIKLRGHRIEPAEIESALRGCPGVGDAAVLIRKNAAGMPRSLAAYVERHPDGRDLQPRQLTSMLRCRLPGYMVPSAIVLLDELPRLPNLKIDRSRLVQIDDTRAAQISDQSSDPLTIEVAKVFERVLGTVGATPDDNVSSLGGDSLQGVQIGLALERQLGLWIPADVFETTQTIGDLAKWIASQSRARIISPDEESASTSNKNLTFDEVLRRLQLTADSWPGVNIGDRIPVFMLNRQGERPPMFWWFNQTDEPARVAHALGPDQPIYAMRSLANIISENRDKEQFYYALAELYTNEILRLPKTDPYFMVGICQGGNIAERTARLLMDTGRDVAQLSFLDYEPKAPYPGRTALFFGAESVEFNPFLKNTAPEKAWKRLHKEIVWDIIPGDHHQYFQTPYLETFLDRLKARHVEAVPPGHSFARIRPRFWRWLYKTS